MFTFPTEHNNNTSSGCDGQAVLFLGPGKMVQTLLLCLHLTSAVYNAVTIIAL